MSSNLSASTRPPVVQPVRTPLCQGGGRGFKTHSAVQLLSCPASPAAEANGLNPLQAEFESLAGHQHFGGGVTEETVHRCGNPVGPSGVRHNVRLYPEPKAIPYLEAYDNGQANLYAYRTRYADHSPTPNPSHDAHGDSPRHAKPNHTAHERSDVLRPSHAASDRHRWPGRIKRDSLGTPCPPGVSACRRHGPEAT